MSVSRRRLLLSGGAIAAALPWMRLHANATLAEDGQRFPSCVSRTGGEFKAPAVRGFHIRAQDGIRLALDLVLPKGARAASRVPTVLVMTRYWRGEVGGGLSEVQSLYASHGYAVVVGDVRGTGASFGTWPYHRSRAETADFTAVLDWIVAQPWSDGRVIGLGRSYTANTADWMAERNHPALVGVVARFPDYDPYADVYFPGGVQNAFMGREWGARVRDLDRNIKQLADGSSASIRPVDGPDGPRLLAAAIEARRNVPSVWEGLQEVTFRDDRPASWHGASMDDWGIHSHADALARSGVPMQVWASWRDTGTANGAIHRFLALPNPQRVCIGPWKHGGGRTADPILLDRPQIDPDLDTQHLEDLCFVERCVAAVAERPRDKCLFYYTIGTGIGAGWKVTDHWPLSRTRMEARYLTTERRLSAAMPETAGRDDYTVDFSVSAGKATRWSTAGGGTDVDYGDRAKVEGLLTYVSDVLACDTEITGHAVVTLHISSTHEDGNFFVYLEDVGRDGVVRYVTEGQLRAIHRRISEQRPPYPVIGPYHSFLRRDALPLVPDAIAELSFVLHPISMLVAAGHRLRIAISGADRDTFARVPATGTPRISVYHGTRYPSRIELPVIHP